LIDVAQKTVKQSLVQAILYVDKAFDVNKSDYLVLLLFPELYPYIGGAAVEFEIRFILGIKKGNLISMQGKPIKIENS
jgi:hypothetical protein